MRLEVVIIALIALLTGAAILTVHLRLPAEILGIVLTVVSTIAALVFVNMSDGARTAIACLVLVIGTLSVLAVLRTRADQEKKASDAQAAADKRYNEDKAESDKRYDQLIQNFELLKELSKSAPTAANIASTIRAGTLKHQVWSLSSEIFGFLLDRQRGEPEPQIALFGAMPMPVGDYAEYIEATATLYNQRFANRVRAAVTELKEHGLSDPALDATLHAVPHPHVANEIAEKLGALAERLPN